MNKKGKQLVIIALYCLAYQAEAGTVRGGGDPLRLTFVQAREHAAQIIPKINEAALPSNLSAEMKSFLISNKNKLAGDILASDHEWIYEQDPNFQACAQTDIPLADEPVIPRAAKVTLYFPLCRQAAPSMKEAAALLIHESVHHFGIQDHAFADQIALSLMKAWELGSLDWERMAQGPSARDGHSLVWTGSEALLFGGSLTDGDGGSADFFAYDVEKRSWRELQAPANLKRSHHQALWTGEEMIIWGGESCVPIPYTQLCSWQWLNSGAAYHPAKNSWRLIDAPKGTAASMTIPYRSYSRKLQEIAWTGDRLLVWGGDCSAAANAVGALWNPADNQWQTLPTARYAQRCSGHSVTYGNDKIHVYGGYEIVNGEPTLSSQGAIYNLKSGSWSEWQTPNWARPRADHSAVWSGKEVIIFSGFVATTDSRQSRGTGLMFSEEHGWQTLATESVLERERHKAVWTGSEMLVYGGKARYLQNVLADVAFFSPTTKTWRTISSSHHAALAPRYNAAIAWTGQQLLINGGMAINEGVTYAKRSEKGAIFRP